MRVVLILIEYALGKIVWLILTSLVFNGLAVVVGLMLTALFLWVMGATWIYGTKKINGEI